MSNSPSRLPKTAGSNVKSSRESIAGSQITQRRSTTASHQRPIPAPKRKELCHLQAKLVHQDAEIAACKSLKAENEELNKANACLKLDLAAREKKVAGLNKRLNTREVEVVELNKKLRGLQNKTEEVENLKSALVSAKQENADLTENIRLRLPESEQQSRILRAALDDARAQLGTSSFLCPESSSKSIVSDQLSTAKAKIEDLQFELEEALAEVGVARTSEDHFERLKAMNTDLQKRYAAAVSQLDGMKIMIQNGKAAVENWKEKHRKLEETREETRPELKTTARMSSVQITSIIYTKPVEPTKPAVASYDESCKSSLSQQSIAVTVNIDPANKAKWALVSRIQAALTKNSDLEILGPPQLVVDLTRKIVEVEADHASKTAKVNELRCALFSQARHLQRLETSGCTVAARRSYADQLEALEQKAAMQDGLLQDWGMKIAAFERAAVEKAAVR